MVDIEKIDDVLYKSVYGRPRTGDYYEIWSRIKSNPEVLREAVQVKRDKFDEHDIVKGLTICDSMLIDYNSVDEVAYNNLINYVYTNTDIARIVMDGAANGGYSFLLYTLFNFDLELTQEMKEFAQNEAMNKIGTTLWRKKRREYSSSLDEAGVSDDVTVNMNIDGMDMPIGAKSGCEYLHYMFSTLSDELAHGTGEYDIRYHILRNPNWSIEEKKELVYDFFPNDNTYDEYLELWEWGIINDKVNYIDDCVPCLDKSDLYYYTFEDLVSIYNNVDTAREIMDEINFCRMMHEIRPQQWEKEFVLKK